LVGHSSIPREKLGEEFAMTHEDTAETVVDCSVDLKNFRRHPRKEVNPPAQTTMLSRKNIQGRGRRPGGVGFVPFSRICDGNPRVAIKNEGDRGARIALGSFRSKEGERSDPIEFVPPDGFGTVRDAEGLRRKSFSNQRDQAEIGFVSPGSSSSQIWRDRRDWVRLGKQGMGRSEGAIGWNRRGGWLRWRGLGG